MYRYLFGPVPSRRLGLSLGVDLLTDKTCSFDCVFCEVGRTRELTIDRKEYVPPGAVLEELSAWVAGGGRADHITLAGMGEPTLNTAFGDVIRGIKGITRTPVALLSNGSLFYLEEVRRAAALADIVKVSLSAWSQESYNRLNRPHEGLSFDKLVDSYIAFRNIFRGELWLEVLIVDGFNSHVDDVTLIAEAAESFAPDKIHINTVVRPGAERDALPVGSEKLEMFARLFNPPGQVVADFRGSSSKQGGSVRDILIRRPCTLEDLAEASGMEKETVKRLLTERAVEWRIESREVSGRTYYVIGDAGL